MQNRTALITGGASGIGRALAEAMAARGVTVVLADRQGTLAEEAADAIRANGGKAWARELDVRDAAAFRALAQEMARREGTVDYLLNNAGIAIGGAVADYDDDVWTTVLDVNVRGVTNGIQAVYPIMRRQHSGHIVNTASMAGFLPMPHGASYAASKHAVVGLSKALRIEGADQGVRVSALCPGAIQTPILLGGHFGGHVGRRLPDSKLAEMWKRMRPMDPATFAQEVLKDMAANEPYIIVPRWWKAMWLLERLAPKVSLRVATRMYAAQKKEFEAHGRDPERVAPADIAIHAE